MCSGHIFTSLNIFIIELSRIWCVNHLAAVIGADQKETPLYWLDLAKHYRIIVQKIIMKT